MDALTPGFHVERVATFPVMDDQDRNELILYRLDPTDPLHGASAALRATGAQRWGSSPAHTA